MKNIIYLIVIFLASCTSKKENKITYPETKKGTVVYEHFGTKVADPYRWLEDDRSTETKNWVKTQNKITFGYLNNIPNRKSIRKRLEEVWNYEKITAPRKRGDYTYFYKNNGLQNQYVIYRQKENITAEIFLNPNTFSKEGTTSLGQVSFTKDGSLVAYAISEGGSDWRKIIIMNALSKEIKEDTIKDVKFSGISWYKNE